MNNQAQSLLTRIEQEQAVIETSQGTALEQIKAAEAILVDVTKQAITQALEKASNKGASSSELTYMAVIAGNTELASRPLMQAAFNGFFKDLFLMSVNQLLAAGLISSTSDGGSKHYNIFARETRKSENSCKQESKISSSGRLGEHQEKLLLS